METLSFPAQSYNCKPFGIYQCKLTDNFQLQPQKRGNLKGSIKNRRIHFEKSDVDKKMESEDKEEKEEKLKIPEIKTETNNKQNTKTDNSNETDNSKKEKLKKKKKWRKMDPSELGFNLTLFPRPVNDACSFEVDEASKKLFEKIEKDCDIEEIITEPYEKLIELENNNRGTLKFIRADRDRKNMKAHKQVKTKHCKNVLNNKGRKALYINHRVYKLMEMDIHRLCYMPSPKKAKNLEKRSVNAPAYSAGPFKSSPIRSNNYRPTPVQCLAHTIHKDNLPGDLDAALANLLMNIQHRDLTPEDYDLLLRLDERVAPKTVSENKLNAFKKDTVESNDELEVCAICMEVYEKGQIRKYLPCQHVFHSSCIDAWLKNSSMNCPIDNLPLES